MNIAITNIIIIDRRILANIIIVMLDIMVLKTSYTISAITIIMMTNIEKPNGILLNRFFILKTII